LCEPATKPAPASIAGLPAVSEFRFEVQIYPRQLPKDEKKRKETLAVYLWSKTNNYGEDRIEGPSQPESERERGNEAYSPICPLPLDDGNRTVKGLALALSVSVSE
jgi:hypothetical protein